MTNASDEFEPCEKCGRVHERNGRATCSAHTRREGERVPCRNFPIEGGRVCRFHGGNAPQVRAAAFTRTAEDHVRNLLSLDLNEIDEKHRSRSPDEQLLDEVALSAQAVEWLRARVAELHVPDPNGGPLEALHSVDEDGNPVPQPVRFSLYGPNHNGDLAIHPLWKQLNEERERHARMCKLAIDAGISERLVRIAEALGQRIVAVIVAVIEELGLPADARDRARVLAAEKLRALGPVIEARAT